MLLITDIGRFYDGRGGSPREHISVLIEGGLVRATGDRSELAGLVGSEVREVVARGKTLIPGLIDAHVHLSLPDSPNALQEVRSIPAEDLASLGILNALKALNAGVTYVRDCGAPGRVGTALTRASRTNPDMLPQIDSSGPCITTTGGHGEDIGTIADSALELRRAVRRLISTGADFIKIMATGGSSDPTDTRRGRAQYSEDELREAVSETHRLGRLVVCHANGTEGIRNAVNAGADVIAHCNWLDAEGVFIDWDQELADVMVRDGVAVDLNVRGALVPTPRFDGGPRVRRWDLLEPTLGEADLLYLTSDGFGAEASRFPHSLMEAAAELDIAPQRLIKLVTTAPARALRLAGLDGIVPGNRANLVLLEGDLETDLHALARPDTVILGGRIVYQRDTDVAQGAHQ